MSSDAVKKVSKEAVEPPSKERGASGEVPKLRSTKLNFFYGAFQALHEISLDVHANKVTSFIGPSGCGKSTFLRTLNRMNETIKGSRAEGEILLDNEDVLQMDVSQLRRRVRRKVD